MRLSAYLILCLLITAPASAGMSYRFEIVGAADAMAGGRSERQGRVWADGERARVEFKRDGSEPFAFDVLIYDGREDGGSIALHTQLKTHYDMPPQIPADGRGPRPAELDEVEVELTTHDRLEDVSGFPCRKYTLSIAYGRKIDFGSEVVELRASQEHQIWTTLEIAAAEPPAEVNAKSIAARWQAVSDKVAEMLQRVEGFPVSLRSKKRLQYVGGSPQDSETTLRLFDFEQAAVPEAKFEIPAGYRYAEPQITYPGKGR